MNDSSNSLVDIPSLAKRFEVIWNKVVLGLFLFLFAMIVSKTALDRMKQIHTVGSVSIARGITSNETSTQQQFDPLVQDLLTSLKVATLAAVSRSTDGDDATRVSTKVEMSSEDELRWKEENPCTSREELTSRYEHRKLVKNVGVPPELNALMYEYTKLHRACIQASGNLTSLFLSKTASNGCKFLVVGAGNGLGNRIMWMVSGLMYAILTQRVLIIDPRTMIPSLMCEPFLGSSWAAPKEFPFVDVRPDLWQSTNEFIAALDRAKKNEKENGMEVSVSINAARGDDSWGPVSRFFCPTEQDFYSKVRWVTLGGCLYFLPKLFVIPTFQPVLESLFKDRTPLMHLLRLSMLPVDLVWAQVRRVEEVYLKNADQLVGVHVRYRGGYEDYLNFHQSVNNNVKQCMLDNAILPNMNNSEYSHWSFDVSKFTSKLSPPQTKLNVLFIASLYSSLYNDFKIVYPQAISDLTPLKEIVSLVHLSSEGKQYTSLETDRRALVEILCLSFSDVLLTSPTSTFSELAHAYGGLKPWIINLHENNGPPCKRGKAIDGCYQGASVFYVCPYDPDVNNDPIVKHVPSLKSCEDGSEGLQFVPK